jgi:parallel beta-helix repeat protein
MDNYVLNPSTQAGQIYAIDCHNISISDQSLLNASVGIYLGLSQEVTINHSSVKGNIYGIYVFSSDNNTVVNSLLSNNSEYGIYINSGSYNRIYNNSFYYNHGSGDTYDSDKIQAYDDDSNNYWNSLSGYGNYWCDWANNNGTNDNNGDGIVDWPYLIDGSAGAEDYYPLKTPSSDAVPIPEFSVLSVVIMFMALLFIMVRRRKE